MTSSSTSVALLCVLAYFCCAEAARDLLRESDITQLVEHVQGPIEVCGGGDLGLDKIVEGCARNFSTLSQRGKLTQESFFAGAEELGVCMEPYKNLLLKCPQPSGRSLGDLVALDVLRSLVKDGGSLLLEIAFKIEDTREAFGSAWQSCDEPGEIMSNNFQTCMEENGASRYDYDVGRNPFGVLENFCTYGSALYDCFKRPKLTDIGSECKPLAAGIAYAYLDAFTKLAQDSEVQDNIYDCFQLGPPGSRA